MPLTGVPELPTDDSPPAAGLTSSSLLDAVVREGAHFERGRLVAREALAA